MEPVQLLQELLRLDTTNPPGDEGPAAEVLRGYLDAAGAETYIHKSESGRPSLIARLPGPSSAAALVLVSHTDVVAVEEQSWTHDPFGGVIEGGFLWGRGALDMKGIAVMHAVALAALAISGAELRREVILLSFADEEAGGREGAESVLRDVPERAGFQDGRPPPDALGEGAFGLSGILDRPIMPIIAAEKSVLWLELIARGDPGHGALPPERQANVNLARVIRRISGFSAPRVHPVMRDQFGIMAEHSSGARAATFKALASGAGSQVANALQKPLRKQGPIAALLSDTVTPTQIQAGYKHNVVPGEARASFDCRLLPDTDVDDFVRKLSKVCSKYDVVVKEVARHGGPVSDRSPLFDAIGRVSSRMHETPVVVPSLTSGMTDLRYLRSRGATAYGWVPLVLDAELLGTIHGHDERIEVRAFEHAVRAMTDLVEEVSV
ncbi:MAG: hypothetical protein QOH26_1321 [Actinomycetota bacterium]|jgi:acetylornithine deacetylase/succinyl-diaminopimelate desuccinylase-like protein|nr:hypothetical protein [Actinomycetota bacterium]